MTGEEEVLDKARRNVRAGARVLMDARVELQALSVLSEETDLALVKLVSEFVFLGYEEPMDAIGALLALRSEYEPKLDTAGAVADADFDLSPLVDDLMSELENGGK